jgi:elongation factor P--(R)-beta-lysine ligase
LVIEMPSKFSEAATAQMVEMTEKPALRTGPESSPWWSVGRHADLRPFLLARNAIASALRAWFVEQGFIEVETSVLQISPGNETHLHAPCTEIVDPGGRRAKRYLRTSPEFACKKLLAAGEAKIFEFARVFRDRERGRLHLPEFTMLEWYRANAPYDAVMADGVVAIAHAAQATGIGRFSYRGNSADPFAEPELLTVAAAFDRFAGIDLLASVANGRGDRESLAAVANTKVRIADDDTWSDIFSKVLVEHIEPNLGQGQLTLLFEYPVPEAALARVKASDPRVAERFEIYACGVELANGFGELIDPVEQRHRFTHAMEEKQRRYGENYPLDEDFLAALASMPEASGVALGFDRLVMLASGATAVDQVVWTPPAGET